MANLILTQPGRPWQTPPTSSASAGTDAQLQLGTPTCRPWWGFGGCFNEMGWEALSLLSESDRARVLDDLFHPEMGCRFNFCRLPIGANDYALSWYSHHERPGDCALEQFSIQRDEQYLLPYLHEAKRRCPDMRLFASPWSPPTWMKFPAAYNYGTLVDDDRVYQAYARYMLKFVQAYRARGFPIEQIHVQNEPDSDQKFPSCRWNASQFTRFIGSHLGPAFAAAGERCEIWLGTIERPEYARWLGPVMLDDASKKHVRGAGFQWAGKYCVADARRMHPDLPLIQTENECGNGENTWAYAHHVFYLIRHYLHADVQAYVYWNMVLRPGGVSTWGWKQNAMLTIDPENRSVIRNPEFYVMKHFSHFIRPGAHQLSLGGSWCLHSVAFANPDGSRAIVLHNPYEQSVTVRVEQERVTLPPQSFATLVL